MGTLHAALEWAKRGFPVFPLHGNGKEPALEGNWIDAATTDESIIRALWIDPMSGLEKYYNVGCVCSDYVVVDIDVKKGKDGLNQYAQMGGTYETLVVRTPSGGYHCYFYGPDSSNAPLADGVDIRSHNGYVVAPGSTIDGVMYEVIVDRDLAWVPQTIEVMLRSPYTRTDVEDDRPLDSQASIQAGINFLMSAPPAIEGMRGDETTFTTACRLCREMALSVPQAFALMRDYWNPQCQPPWDLEELYRKVENAAAYGSADLGLLTPETLFGHLVIPEPPSMFEQMGSDWGNAILPERIAPRPWLVDKALMHRAVTLLLASGSAGKSSWSLALAAHMSLGLDFAGFTVHKACKVMVYNGEDDIAEQSRRLLAACIEYGLHYAEVKKNILLMSARDIKMELVSKEFNKPVRNDVLIQQIIEKTKDPEVGLLILDPLVKIHKCDESDNVQMDAVMETLTDIAHDANIAILALHHTNKNNSRQEDRQGNMDNARGASAIVNAARIAFTLLNASQNDAEEYGFSDDERNQWVRLDDAKMNMSLASNKAKWFRKRSVQLQVSQDWVGVIKYEIPERSYEALAVRLGRILAQTMVANGSGSMTMAQAMAVIRAGERLMANKKDNELKSRIEGLFAIGAVVDGRTIKVVRDEQNPTQVAITMS